MVADLVGLNDNLRHDVVELVLRNELPVDPVIYCNPAGVVLQWVKYEVVLALAGDGKVAWTERRAGGCQPVDQPLPIIWSRLDLGQERDHADREDQGGSDRR